MDNDKIKAILFDIGDTLIDASKISNEALYEASKILKQKGYLDDINKFISTYKEVDNSIQSIHINHLYSDFKIINRVWKILFSKKNYSAIGIFLDQYRSFIRKNIKVDRDLISFFENIKSKNIKLGIISDGTINEQLETLSLLGIIEFFDTIIISEEYGCEKPSSKLFQIALKKLEVRPENTIMIGDDIYRDISGAYKIGIKTVLFERYREFNITNITSDLRISNLIEIYAYLEGV